MGVGVREVVPTSRTIHRLRTPGLLSLLLTVACADVTTVGDVERLPDAGTAEDADAGRLELPDDAGSNDAGWTEDGGAGWAEDASLDAGVAPMDAGAVDEEDAGSAGPIEDPTDWSEVPLADPDTVLARDGRYITYGTTLGAGRGPRCGGRGKLYVPYLVHGSGNSVRMSDCAAGDAMPDGPGAWAEPGGAIWAPGVVRFGDRYFMFYTASRRGSGQKCIGRATSGSARGPFVSRGEWACPAAGRWVIDANPIVAGGRMYVAYRDDAITSFPETGLAVVRTDDSGRAVWSTRRDLLVSTDIRWETIRISGTSHVIENPSLFRHGGTWYVAYSGNNWDSARYATGIADCGSGVLPLSRCAPMRRGVQRPFFGFTGAGGLDPYRGLPGNHQGPGGMDVFQAADGTLRAVWHWWRPSDRSRHLSVGRLLTNAGGFYVGR